MADVLIAEDLAMMLIEERTGKPITDSTRFDHALAGAVLVELALRGRVDVDMTGGWTNRGKLVIVNPSPTGHPVLDSALQRIAAKSARKPKYLLLTLAKGLRPWLLRGMAQAGVLREEQHKILGLFPTRRWPTADTRYAADVRAKLGAVLVQGVPPDQYSGALISLLSAIDVVPKVIYAPDRRELKRRAKEVAQGQWAAEAVRRAVADVNAAVVTAVTAAATAGAAGGGS